MSIAGVRKSFRLRTQGCAVLFLACVGLCNFDPGTEDDNGILEPKDNERTLVTQFLWARSPTFLFTFKEALYDRVHLAFHILFHLRLHYPKPAKPQALNGVTG